MPMPGARSNVAVAYRMACRGVRRRRGVASAISSIAVKFWKVAAYSRVALSARGNGVRRGSAHGIGIGDIIIK